MDKSSNLIWIDLEMTGLNTAEDTIIEIATIVTDKHLNELAEGPVVAIGQTQATTTEEGTFCVIEIPEIRESGYRIFGVDDAQAIELSHMPVERMFDHHGVIRVED